MGLILETSRSLEHSRNQIVGDSFFAHSFNPFWSALNPKPLFLWAVSQHNMTWSFLGVFGVSLLLSSASVVFLPLLSLIRRAEIKINSPSQHLHSAHSEEPLPAQLIFLAYVLDGGSCFLSYLWTKGHLVNPLFILDKGKLLFPQLQHSFSQFLA